MGEIKSTLDIIMEKTKGLTATEEEKEAFKKAEVEGKVRGFLQKFLDGLLDEERLKMEMAAFSGDKLDMARETLKEECLRRIDPEEDNTPFFKVLKHVAGMDAGPFQRVLSAFHEDLERQGTLREEALRERLRQRGVSGSAAVPNLKADPEWIHSVLEMKAEFRKKVRGLMK